MAGKFTEKQTPLQKVLTVIGSILCVIFGLMLIGNITVVVKGALHPEKPPTVFGTAVMVTLSGSMDGSQPDSIPAGSVVIVGEAEPEELKAGDVITFMDGSTADTHRIVEVQTAEDGSIQWITKGDANNTEDSRPVSQSQLVGKYKMHIPKLGNLILFMSSNLGMLLFVGLPLIAFVVYDIIRRQNYVNKERTKTAEMKAEIKRLRALAGEPEPSDLEE